MGPRVTVNGSAMIQPGSVTDICAFLQPIQNACHTSAETASDAFIFQVFIIHKLGPFHGWDVTVNITSIADCQSCHYYLLQKGINTKNSDLE